MKTSYNYDFYQRNTEKSETMSQQQVMKSFKANFRIGNKDLESNFISTNSEFQSTCLNSNNLKIQPDQNENNKRSRTVSTCIGNGSQMFMITSNNDFYRGEQLPDIRKSHLINQKIRALNIFSSNPPSLPDENMSQYQSNFVKNSLNDNKIIKNNFHEHQLKNCSKISTDSHINFGKNFEQTTTTMKSAYQNFSISGKLNNQPVSYSNKQSFNISENKYKNLPSENNPNKTCQTNFSFPEVDVENMKSKSYETSFLMGFHRTDYSTENINQFCPNKNDLTKNNHFSQKKNFDFKKSGAGKSLWKNEPLVSSSLYTENFKAHDLTNFKNDCCDKNKHTNGFQLGFGENSYQTTTKKEYFNQF